MIVFASSLTDPERYEQCAAAGIRLVAEPDSEVLANAAAGSIFRSYNLILDMVAEREDLEALVLLHQDTELASPGFCATLRQALRDPDVAVVGCVGAVGVRSIAWWEGSVTWAGFTHRYPELGGGELPALSWEPNTVPAYARTGEVDTVDGFVLGLSPWAVRNVRFDESLGQLHGYDFDYCLQVRAAGRKVVTADFRAVHHHTLELVSNPETWLAAHMRVAEKWDGCMPGVAVPEEPWEQRARRAEGEAALARTQAVAEGLQAGARAAQLEGLLAEVTNSTSWRVTRPLRRLNAARKARGRPAR
jgi:Glycosyltransferase like family